VTAPEMRTLPVPDVPHGVDVKGGDQRPDQERVGEAEERADPEAEVSLGQRTGAGQHQDDQLVGHDDAGGEDQEEEWEAPVEGEGRTEQLKG